MDQAHIVLETVKVAEDGSGDLILRLYESKKAAGSAWLSWALEGYEVAYACNMLEEPQEKLTVVKVAGENSVQLNFRAFEVKTVRLKKA